MKTFLIGIILGLFGAFAVALAFGLQWPAWVMFIAWVSYYIFGKTLKTSLLAFIQILFGIIMGILMQASGIFLTRYVGEAGLPVAVFFFIGSLAYISRLKTCNNIPAYFLGLIILFGVHPQVAIAPLLELLIPIIAGFTLAWLNDSSVVRLSRLYDATKQSA